MSPKPSNQSEARPATASGQRPQATKPRPSVDDPGLRIAHPHAAGIDVHSREHWVCVPAHSAPPRRGSGVALMCVCVPIQIEPGP